MPYNFETFIEKQNRSMEVPGGINHCSVSIGDRASMVQSLESPIWRLQWFHYDDPMKEMIYIRDTSLLQAIGECIQTLLSLGGSIVQHKPLMFGIANMVT